MKPRFRAYLIASTLGLASLFFYQNCGAPQNAGSGSSSVAQNDFYRWMPDTFISFSCGNALAREDFPSSWVMASKAGAPVNSNTEIPSGVRLSESARAAYAGQDIQSIRAELPEFELLLADLKADSVVGKTSADWRILDKRAVGGDPNVLRGDKLLNAGLNTIPGQGAPGTRLASAKYEPFGKDGLYLNKPMAIANLEREGDSPKVFALGLFFAPKDFDINDKYVIRKEVAEGRDGYVGSAIVVSVVGRVISDIGVYSDDGRSAPESKTKWTCPATTPINQNFTSPNLKNRLFMVFHAEVPGTNNFVTWDGDPVPPADYYCELYSANIDQNRVDQILGVPAELKSKYYFGRVVNKINPSSSRVVGCVVPKVKSPDDCYPQGSFNNGPVGPLSVDYSMINPFQTATPAAGTVAPHWMSICIRN